MVIVSRMVGSGVWGVRATRGWSGMRGTSGGSGGTTRGHRGGIGRGGWNGMMSCRASIRVVIRFPAKAGGTLIDWTLVAVMAKAVTRVTSLMVMVMGTWERDLCIPAGPP